MHSNYLRMCILLSHTGRMGWNYKVWIINMVRLDDLKAPSGLKIWGHTLNLQIIGTWIQEEMDILKIWRAGRKTCKYLAVFHVSPCAGVVKTTKCFWLIQKAQAKQEATVGSNRCLEVIWAFAIGPQSVQSASAHNKGFGCQCKRFASSDLSLFN